MQFCPKCKTMMQPDDKEGTKKIELVCPKCNYRERADEEKNITVETQEKTEDVVVIGKQGAGLPETKNECQKCHNTKAYWWLEQTRSADEAPTRFYKCTKCGNTWREYS